ncbi:MAG: hypothetical protein OEW00_11890 [candidate division Zixibacteria bacterium]|nr:hypothetical protein [candidate division Zixibacteria bacterium]
MHLFNRAKHALVLPLLAIVSLTGCSKDDGNGNPAGSPPLSDGYLWVYHAGDSVKVVFADLPKIVTEGEEAIQLEEFIDTDLIPMFVDKDENEWEARLLYSYQILGEDGFCASSKGYRNNIWSHMQMGHILTASRRVVFPDAKIDLPGAYNIKATRRIRIHRKIDVVAPDTADFIETSQLTPVSVTNWDGQPEDAIALRDLITPLVEHPDNYNYDLVSLDGYSPDGVLTWTQFQTGYWLLSSERTIFTDPDLASGKYRLKVLEKVLVTE